MRMARVEIIQESDKAVNVIVGARDVVTAAEVHPLHLRQHVAELLLESGKHLAQLFNSLLAQAVEVKTVERFDVSMFRSLGV